METNILLQDKIIETLARAVEYYLVHYVWDILAERDNAAAAEEYFRLREIIN